MTAPVTYAVAGVNVQEGNRAVELMKDKVRSSFRPEVLGDLGGFAGAFRLLNLPQYRQPVLLAATDGVGTKLKIAFAMENYQSIGQDLVAMCVNDLLVHGAEPLFFLDYYASAKTQAEQVAAVVGAIADACKEAGCSLIGGETAELPGFYQAGEFDLAGFAVGIVDEPLLVTGNRITPGDIILGLPSSGLHSNGFALVRYLVEQQKLSYREPAPWDEKQILGNYLLTPTRLYVKTIRSLLAGLPEHTLKGMVHITGGGFMENIPRVLPDKMQANIVLGSWSVPQVFAWLQKQGNITIQEMLTTFNYGIGFVLIVAPQDRVKVQQLLMDLGEVSYILGEVSSGTRKVELVTEVWEN